MIHPERIREKMDEQKDVDQTNWVRFEIPTIHTVIAGLTDLSLAHRAIWMGQRRPNILCPRRQSYLSFDRSSAAATAKAEEEKETVQSRATYE